MENLKTLINLGFDKIKNSDRKVLIKAAIGILILVVAFSFNGIKNMKENKEKGNFKKIESQERTGNDIENIEEGNDKIIVQVAGAVVRPKICHMPKDTRVYQIVEEAGGFLADADPSNLNLAAPVNDGDKVYVPRIGEISDPEKAIESVVNGKVYEVSGNENDSIININRATREELQQIPGIGPSTADKIVTWRKENGNFSKPEDIKKINGIGDKTFEKMRDKIRTN